MDSTAPINIRRDRIYNEKIGKILEEVEEVDVDEHIRWEEFESESQDGYEKTSSEGKNSHDTRRKTLDIDEVREVTKSVF